MEMQELPPASIVMSVHNHLEHTRQCLESIIQNTAEELYEVIIVDNASSDGTAQFLGLLVGDVKVISNETNRGLSVAFNQGAELADRKYVVFLGNHCRPQKGWLDSLIELAEREPRTGAVGAKLIRQDGAVREAGSVIFANGTVGRHGSGMHPAEPRLNFVREVDLCSLDALLVRREIWRAIGGFDVRYETDCYSAADLCCAIRRAGYRVLYQPAAVVNCQGEPAHTFS
ncbi:MAG: glycosyltransferase family 2 protein [Chloroflexota bacterium]|nr:MAG: glycosyltransferase family 2 protein [Chloroflexota bacterium]